MSNDREKLLRVMKSLEADYHAGRISEEKFRYFYSKYSDKLNAMNATNRIRSMQGKKKIPNKNIGKRNKAITNKREEERLVQKYIVNPKKGDFKNKNKTNEDESWSDASFKFIVFLILAIAFTAGIGFGVFNFNFGDMSVTNSAAIVKDTAFPEINQVPITNITSENYTSSDTLDESETTDTSESNQDNTGEYTQNQNNVNHVTPTQEDINPPSQGSDVENPVT